MTNIKEIKQSKLCQFAVKLRKLNQNIKQKSNFLFKPLQIQKYIKMGVYLSEPNREKKVTQGQNKGISFCAVQMQGWRKNMQDADICLLDIGDGNSLFAVFDGHGGHEVSKYVEKIFVNQLQALDLYKKKDYPKALEQAFRKIDDKICSKEGATFLRDLRQSPDSYDQICNGTGCTANVVLITPTHYYVANAGDSRSVLCRNGKALELSYDHKPESQEQENRIRKAGGYIQMGRVNGGLNLSRSFGDFNYKRNSNLSWAEQMITCKPDVKIVERTPQDEFIILGCDGIWERFVDNSQQLINIVNQQLKAKRESRKIMETLLDDLLAKQTSMGIGCDNMTAILIRLNV